MTTIIGLTGFARSGKDTVGQILVDQHGFERRAFADKLRAVALGADPYVEVEHGFARLSSVVNGDEWTCGVGWDRAKTDYPDVRRFLQRLGTEGVRDNLGSMTWIDAAMVGLRLHGVARRQSKLAVVFTDVRFPNEVAAIQGLGGQVWRVVRPGVEPPNAHASEQVLDGIDKTLLNNGNLLYLSELVTIVLRESRLI